ncbi:acyltransferase family protein [Paenibacillus abyssi]|uniref:Acyltransferase n=1 Tax=Paenibacillus abyssi TaxID=1340531 RepID=A0A917CLU1_9BACL|nr:acyltransferase family protein [Paenibacillus abyssi]GGF92188.1 acyltransferase [Paenibacillus abyssi]
MCSRDHHFDNIKFFLIALVVIGHTIEPLIDDQYMKSIYFVIYTFHIPLFAFISGYFSKKIEAGDYTEKIISRLAVPYVLLELAYSLFDYFLFKREQFVVSFFTPYWIMWFLFSLILWKIILPYVIKFRFALPLSIILAILIGYAEDVGYYASISRTFVFFPFFLAGYYFDKRYLDKLYAPVFRFSSAAGFIILFLAFYYYGSEINVQWFYGSVSYAALGLHEWYAGMYRFALFLLSVVMGFCAILLIPRNKVAFFTDMGRNTLYAFLLHGFIIRYLFHAGFYGQMTTPSDRFLLIPLGFSLAAALSLNRVQTLFAWMAQPKLDFIFKDVHRNSSVTRSSQMTKRS